MGVTPTIHESDASNNIDASDVRFALYVAAENPLPDEKNHA